MSQVSKGVVVQDQADLLTLVNEGGVLVVKGELLDDLSDVVRHEHDRRVADLVRQIELDLDALARLNEQVVGMTILNASRRQPAFAAA